MSVALPLLPVELPLAAELNAAGEEASKSEEDVPVSHILPILNTRRRRPANEPHLAARRRKLASFGRQFLGYIRIWEDGEMAHTYDEGLSCEQVEAVECEWDWFDEELFRHELMADMSRAQRAGSDALGNGAVEEKGAEKGAELQQTELQSAEECIDAEINLTLLHDQELTL